MRWIITLHHDADAVPWDDDALKWCPPSTHRRSMDPSGSATTPYRAITVQHRSTRPCRLRLRWMSTMNCTPEHLYVTYNPLRCCTLWQTSSKSSIHIWTIIINTRHFETGIVPLNFKIVDNAHALLLLWFLHLVIILYLFHSISIYCILRACPSYLYQALHACPGHDLSYSFGPVHRIYFCIVITMSLYYSRLRLKCYPRYCIS
jgi:hypothetical protein